jgi:hypothetical protein
VIKRLKKVDRVLTDSIIVKMKHIGELFYGKDYDTTFEWSDDKVYCSELVWKIYQRGAGIEIGEIQRLRDFDTTSHIVKQILKKRYGNNPPWEEKVISPVAIYNSTLLKFIQSNE